MVISTESEPLLNLIFPLVALALRRLMLGFTFLLPKRILTMSGDGCFLVSLRPLMSRQSDPLIVNSSLPPVTAMVPLTVSLPP